MDRGKKIVNKIIEKIKEKFDWSLVAIFILIIVGIGLNIIYGQMVDMLVFMIIIIISIILLFKKSSKFDYNSFNIEKECEFLDGNSKEKYYEKLVDLRNNTIYIQIGFIVTICISGTLYKLNIIKIFDTVGVVFAAAISLIMMKLFTDAYKHFLNQAKVYEKKIGINEKFEYMSFNNTLNHIGLFIFLIWFIFVVGGALREIRIERNSKEKKYENTLIEKLEQLDSKELKYIEATVDFILNKKI